MLESNVKRKIVKEVKAAGGYARRLEDRFAVGLPDMMIIFPGSPVFFAEVKIIEGRIFRPSPRQLIELQRIGISYSTEPIVIGYADGTYYFSEPKETIYGSDCIYTMPGETFSQTLKRWYNGKITASKDHGRSGPIIQ